MLVLSVIWCSFISIKRESIKREDAKAQNIVFKY